MTLSVHTKLYSVALFLIIIVPNLYTVESKIELNQTKNGENYDELYSTFDDKLFSEFGITENLQDVNNPIFNALDQAFGMITYIQLYDVFGEQIFLERAKQLADIVYTNFQDPRFDLIANFYDSDAEILSNHRFSIDNFLIAWALDDLVTKIDRSDLLLVRDYEQRAIQIVDELDNFVNEIFFMESYRVDNPTLSFNFNAYVNLMLSFIILESGSELFQSFIDLVVNIYDFINLNLKSPEGGIYSLYFNGFHDDIITLRNTALHSIIGFELYLQTENESYLNNAIEFLQFFKVNFVDLGITRGYFETIVGSELVQLSKSLFSHSLLLLAFLKSANLGNFDSSLDLQSMWGTITQYFRNDNNNLFYSTIDRAGNPASQFSRSIDNLLMIFTLSRLSTIAQIEFSDRVDFRDNAIINVSHIVPSNVTSLLTLKFEEEIVKEVNVTGTGELTTTEFKVGLVRPSSDSKDQPFSIEISTLNLVFDKVADQFIITANVGIELSASTITMFSAVLIVFFVLLVNELSKTKVNPKIKG